MTKYKIVRYKDLGNWFMYKRYLLFFWKQVNYFIRFEKAADYVLKHNGNNPYLVEYSEQNTPKHKKKFYLING